MRAQEGSLRPAQVPLALDPDAYRNLLREGLWTLSAAEYAGAALRVQVECGKLAWARCQDWPCDPEFLAVTGLTQEDHQRMTVESFVDLRSRSPRVRWLPVLHGRDLEDYLRHAEMYEQAGVDLVSRDLVGVGSVGAERGSDRAVSVLEGLRSRGMSIHGFGVGLQSIGRLLPFLVSSSSAGWSNSPGAGQGEAEAYRKSVLKEVRDLRAYESYDGILGFFGGDG